ncbi:cytochrome C assembly family protein [Ramlibacter sp. PS4R-6]|uniref:cytochrome C assembly family protein n=1 Tax=Ramlibacter sp. PS4R-6 TaxID=3133438 RepID=UPI003096D8D2
MILATGSDVIAALAVLAALAYAVSAAGASRLGERGASLALGAAWLMHLGAIVLSLLASPPRFGFAPALSMTAWLVVTVYAIERQMFPQLVARWAFGVACALAALLPVAFPGDPLRLASALGPLHLALGVASYGLFGAAAVHAWLMMRAEQSIRAGADGQAGLPLLTLERLTFRFAGAGFAVLSATLLAGIVFREHLGAWRWDHKTVFSLLAWAVFAALLLGRARFGWRGRKAVRVLYTGALLLLLAYAGSRFVLEVILRRSA